MEDNVDHNSARHLLTSLFAAAPLTASVDGPTILHHGKVRETNLNCY